MKKRFCATYANYETTVYRATGKVNNDGSREYLSLTDVSLELTEKVVLNATSNAEYLLRLTDEDEQGKAEIIAPISLEELGQLAGYTATEQARQHKLFNTTIQALVYASELYENGAIKVSYCKADNSLYGYSRRDTKRISVIIPVVA
jgi:hypothetical protein